MRVPVLKLNQPTGTGRIYPDWVVKKAIAVAELPMMGTMEFPADGVISLDRVSHKVEKLDIVGDTLYATVKILNTPLGIVLDHIKDDVAFRTSGIGTVDENNVVHDLVIVSVAAVNKATAA
jgi:hypothetical protein